MLGIVIVEAACSGADAGSRGDVTAERDSSGIVIELLEFGADYMLVEQPDSLGVERVFEYLISPPSGPRR